MLKEHGYKSARISQLIKATRPVVTDVSHGTPEKNVTSSTTAEAISSDESSAGSTETDKSSSETKAYRRKFWAKEVRTKLRREKKRKLAPSPSSSHSKQPKEAASSEAAGLPLPEAKLATLQVRRITAIGPDGKAAIKDDDLVDEVDVQGDETIYDLIRRLFRQQGAEEDLGNWRFLELRPDGKAVPVGCYRPAKSVPMITLARKGG